MYDTYLYIQVSTMGNILTKSIYDSKFIIYNIYLLKILENITSEMVHDHLPRMPNSN